MKKKYEALIKKWNDQLQVSIKKGKLLQKTKKVSAGKAPYLGDVFSFRLEGAKRPLFWAVINEDREHGQSFIVPCDIVGYEGSFDMAIPDKKNPLSGHILRLMHGYWADNSFILKHGEYIDNIGEHYYTKAQYIMHRIVNDTWQALPHQDLTQQDPAYEEYIAELSEVVALLKKQLEAYYAEQQLPVAEKVAEPAVPYEQPQKAKITDDVYVPEHAIPELHAPDVSSKTQWVMNLCLKGLSVLGIDVDSDKFDLQVSSSFAGTGKSGSRSVEISLPGRKKGSLYIIIEQDIAKNETQIRLEGSLSTLICSKKPKIKAVFIPGNLSETFVFDNERNITWVIAGLVLPREATIEITQKGEGDSR